MFPDRPYKSICRDGYSTNRPYKSICRDPCVGAAGRTAPTNAYWLPLKTIFDVVKRGGIHARNHRSSSKKQFIHQRQMKRDSTQHKSTHPQIDLYITGNGEGLSTHQLIHKLIFHKLIHTPYREGRPGGQSRRVDPRRAARTSTRKKPLLDLRRAARQC